MTMTPLSSASQSNLGRPSLLRVTNPIIRAAVAKEASEAINSGARKAISDLISDQIAKEMKEQIPALVAESLKPKPWLSRISNMAIGGITTSVLSVTSDLHTITLKKATEFISSYAASKKDTVADYAAKAYNSLPNLTPSSARAAAQLAEERAQAAAKLAEIAAKEAAWAKMSYSDIFKAHVLTPVAVKASTMGHYTYDSVVALKSQVTEKAGAFASKMVNLPIQIYNKFPSPHFMTANSATAVDHITKLGNKTLEDLPTQESINTTSEHLMQNTSQFATHTFETIPYHEQIKAGTLKTSKTIVGYGSAALGKIPYNETLKEQVLKASSKAATTVARYPITSSAVGVTGIGLYLLYRNGVKNTYRTLTHKSSELLMQMKSAMPKISKSKFH